MSWSFGEILDTVRMTELEHFDIRTVTMGINLKSCRSDNFQHLANAIYDRICFLAEKHLQVAGDIERQYGITIANKRISVTPISLVADGCSEAEFIAIGKRLDDAAESVGVDFLAGFTALVQKGSTAGEENLMRAIPETLAATEHLCASVNVASTRAGINMDAVRLMGEVICNTAKNTAAADGIGCAKLVVFCNAVEDNPFVAGAFHGISEPDVVINVGISGPGVVLRAVRNKPDLSHIEIAELIKKTAFKITRAGHLIGTEVARRQQVPFGIVDISLAPTPEADDSVGEILRQLGVEDIGAPGTTAALAMLNDAVKKGGMMASSSVGGMSGAFIPVSEDAAMIEAARAGHLTLEKLEAMTCVCSVGLDMIAVPGDTPATSIAGVIADEAAIGMINNKTTAVRIIPVPGKTVGDTAEYGGLLGSAPVMPISKLSAGKFVARAGRIPAPVQSLTN
jgi:uncharacterized protein (UPF0210 family)